MDQNNIKLECENKFRIDKQLYVKPELGELFLADEILGSATNIKESNSGYYNS